MICRNTYQVLFNNTFVLLLYIIPSDTLQGIRTSDHCQAGYTADEQQMTVFASPFAGTFTRLGRALEIPLADDHHRTWARDSSQVIVNM